MSDKSNEKYSQQEAQQRFEAALRGSRKVGPKPMKDIPRKRPKPAGSSKKSAAGRRKP